METMNWSVPAGAAGVSVRYDDSSTQLRQGQLGIACLIAPFAKGLTGAAHRIRDVGGLRRVFGRPLEDDYSGVAARAYLQLAGGDGALHGYRVTDGTLDAQIGTLRLYARKCLASRVRRHTVDSGQIRAVAQTAYALSGGEWAGPGMEFCGSVSDSGLTGSTINLGTTYNDVWAANELVGRKFKLGASPIVWEITGNTASHATNGPALTLSKTFAGYTITGGNVLFRIYDDNLDDNSERMEATVRVGDDPTRPATRWGMSVGLDGAPVSPYFSDLDLADQAAIARAIQAAVSQGYQEVGLRDDEADIADAALPQNRPCNWSGIVLPADLDDADITTVGKAKTDGNKVYLQIHEFIVDTASGNKPVLSAAPTLPSTVVPQVWTLTFTSASAFTATVVDPQTGESMALGLPSGSTGSAYPGGVFADHPNLASFTVTADASIASGTIVKLYVWPLPTGLKNRNAFVFGSAWDGTGRTDSGDPGTNTSAPAVTKRWRIIENGADWIRVQGESSTLASTLQAPKAPFVVGTDTSNSHDVSSPLTFKYNIEINGVAVHGTDITLTTSTLTSTTTTAALAADLNTKSGASQDDVMFFATSDHKLMAIVSSGDAGGEVVLAIKDGTVNAAVGFTDDADHTGDDGAVVRIEFDQGLRGARYEAGEVSFTDLQNALAQSEDNPLAAWVLDQPGFVQLYMPGVTDWTTIQALIDFCHWRGGCEAVWDLPNNLADEGEAVSALQANVTVERVFATQWPSWAETTQSPRAASREVVPLGGAILGAEARWANNPLDGRGWHKASAGDRVRLDPYVSRLVKDAAAAVNLADLIRTMNVDQGILNSAGIRPVFQNGRAFYVFGDESPNRNFAGTYWIHKQRAVFHVAQLLRVNLRPLLYRTNNGERRTELVATIRDIFRPLVAEGWFDPINDGDAVTLSSCVRILASLANNPVEVRNLGKLVAGIQFRVVNTTKVIEIGIGTSGVSVGLAA